MNDRASFMVRFSFYSDTNANNAYEELQLLALKTVQKDQGDILVGMEDFLEMRDSIEIIIEDNGGKILG